MNQPYSLAEFIADVDQIVSTDASADRITERISPLLARLVTNPETIPAELRRPPADGRRGRYMLHRAPSFNITSVVWRPGDSAGAHNHETWGVIGVVENKIEETRYRVNESVRGGAVTLEVKEVLTHGPGAMSRLVPGDEIHAMHNVTDRDTLEIHVYGKDLAGLHRRTWDAEGNERPLISPPYLNC